MAAELRPINIIANWDLKHSQRSCSISFQSCFLSISVQVLESRALYNLGNVYHARGKSTTTVGLASNSEQESAEHFVKASLTQAARHYE